MAVQRRIKMMMSGLFSFKFIRMSVSTCTAWRIFAICVILLTMIVFLGDRDFMVGLKLRDKMRTLPIRPTPNPHQVTYTDPKLGVATRLKINSFKINTAEAKSETKQKSGSNTNIERKDLNGVNLYSKYQHKSEVEKLIFKPKPKPRLWTDEKSLQSFKKAITLEEEYVFKELMKKFAKFAQENELEYCLCCGSLLGSYRHHGMIPWDDDLDVMMISSQKKALKSAFTFNPHSLLILDTSRIDIWKVYFNSSNPIKGYHWKWPFLDLIFFRENRTHIWRTLSNTQKLTFQKSSIYPVISRPFWDLWLPAPRDTESVLKSQSNVDICTPRHWNHKLEKRISGFYRAVPCISLYGRIPLVRRRVLNDSATIESLLIGNRTLSAVRIRKT